VREKDRCQRVEDHAARIITIITTTIVIRTVVMSSVEFKPVYRRIAIMKMTE
jgi:hypothetical protein